MSRRVHTRSDITVAFMAAMIIVPLFVKTVWGEDMLVLHKHPVCESEDSKCN